MKSKVMIVGIFTALSLILVACAPPALENLVDPADTTWVLESYGEQGNLQAVLEGSEITAIFNSDDGQVQGSAGCNTYFANYHITNNMLSIYEIAYTEMYCLEPEGVMDQEEQYLEALQAAESYHIEDGKLRITSGAQLLVFGTE